LHEKILVSCLEFLKDVNKGKALLVNDVILASDLLLPLLYGSPRLGKRVPEQEEQKCRTSPDFSGSGERFSQGRD